MVTTTVVQIMEGDSSNIIICTISCWCVRYFFNILTLLSLNLEVSLFNGIFWLGNTSCKFSKMLSFWSGMFSRFEEWNGWFGEGRNQTRLGTSSIKSVKYIIYSYIMYFKYLSSKIKTFKRLKRDIKYVIFLFLVLIIIAI